MRRIRNSIDLGGVAQPTLARRAAQGSGEGRVTEVFTLLLNLPLNGKGIMRWLAVILLLVSTARVSSDAGAEEASHARSSATEQDLIAGDRLAPKAFRSAAQKVLPSIVYIESFGGIPQDQGGIGGIRRPGDGPTTGLILSADGYIVTSTFNFIKQPPIITAHLPDGTRHVAKLLGRDDTRGICLLKIDNVVDLPTPEFVPRSELRVGQWVIAVGVGFGDKTPAISAGIISATSRIMGRAVQTDANTSPANYGGPLVDIDGRVIGICVPLSPGSQEDGSGVQWYDSGIGFAVPLEENEPLLAQLKEGKTIRAGYLGIQVNQLPGHDDKVIISSVTKGSPAQEAGLKVGDRVVAVDDEQIVDTSQLRIAIGRNIEGDTVNLSIQRDEEQLELKVILGAARNQSPSQTNAKSSKGKRPSNPESRRQ